MAIDLHTRVDISLPGKKQGEDDDDHGVTVTLPPSSRDHHNNGDSSSSGLKAQVLIPHHFGTNIRTSSALPRYREEQGKDEDLVAELTRHTAHFLLQGDDKFDFSGIVSRNSEPSWDSSMGSREPSSPPGNNREYCCRETTYDAVGMLEKMRIGDRSDNSRYHHGYGTQSLKNSNVGNCSRQSLIHEQIRASQLSRLKQEQILALKQKLAAYRELEYKEQIMQLQKKGHSFGIDDNTRSRNNRIPGLGPLLHQQPPCSELGGSDSRGASCGTGVFLPRGRINGSSVSRKRPGKGCSNILVPARVVQALQLHYDQMALTYGPKHGSFPPLHDVLVSNRDGMYSLQKRQLRKPPANMQNDMILPQDWTY